MASEPWRCQCGQPATRAYCYPGEPWVPYCKDHKPPAYYEHSDIPIAQMDQAQKMLPAMFRTRR